jgi:hypothetical protein
MTATPIHGWLAEFDGASVLLNATTRLRAAGYTHVEAYSPFPVSGLADVLQPSARNPIARLVLVGGLIGGLGMLALQWYASAIAYPVNIGGRPLASWPAFIPAALEMTFLAAAVFGVVGMLVGAGAPRLYHPAFNVARFEAASRDGFFVLVSADDPRCHDGGKALRQLLDELGALDVNEVPA